MNQLLPDTDSEDELPQGWEAKISLTNRIYYVNHNAKKTQWHHPISGKRKAVDGKLPDGWKRVVDDEDNGVTYYNNQTTYTDPRLASAYDISSDNALDFTKELDSYSTTNDVLANHDLSGKTVIITGANCGIGFETAKALAIHGAHVILACRNEEKAKRAIVDIKSVRQKSQLTFIPCDLARLRSVKEFCDHFLAMNLPLDILILNAAVNALPYTLTEDGYEMTFQVNHLSHFYMVRLMERKMIESQTRVVVVSSESHRMSMIDADYLHQDWNESNFVSFMAYNDSKLCNILLANELHRRLGDRKNVVAVSCHPGNMVNTSLQRYWWFLRILYYLARPFTKSPNQGAATVVYAAVAPQTGDLGGSYLNNCRECEPSQKARDPNLARLLWERCEEMINSSVSFQDKI